jgi:thioredoxin-like negative regulator of GroEL
MHNVEQVMQSPLPTLLVFHAPSHPEVAAYSKAMMDEVMRVNVAAATAANGKSSPPVLQLGLINCEREPGLMQQFRVSPQEFPMCYVMFQGRILDRAVGILEPAHIAQLIHTFLEYCNNAQAGAAAKPEEEAQKSADAATASSASGADIDMNDVKAVVAAAFRQLAAREFEQAAELLRRAHDLAEPEIAILKANLGIGKKKVTPEMQEKLRKDPNCNAMAHVLAGFSLIALAQGQVGGAAACIDEMRNQFPWATRDVRVIGDAAARVELIRLTGFQAAPGDYATFVESAPPTDALENYLHQLRVAVAHYFLAQPERSIEALLGAIRSEAKLMPQFKEKGLLEKWAQLPGAAPGSSNAQTLARRLIFVVFEALGNDKPAVIAARKRLAAYL